MPHARANTHEEKEAPELSPNPKPSCSSLANRAVNRAARAPPTTS